MRERDWNKLKIGDVVVAKRTVYDLPPDKSWVHADVGEFGIVINTEPGHVTVRFNPSHTCTDVAPSEIRKPTEADFCD